LHENQSVGWQSLSRRRGTGKRKTSPSSSSYFYLLARSWLW